MRTTVIDLLRHTADTFTLRLSRNHLEFRPGHHIHLGFPKDTITREYSIASSPRAKHLDILIRLVPRGYLTPRLLHLAPGAELEVTGPFGEFLLEDAEQQVLIATGTGVAPYLSFSDSFPGEHLRVLHGMARVEESWPRNRFRSGAYVACVSREDGGDFHGRVTDYLRTTPIDPSSRYYLCGRTDMIYEVFGLLTAAGVPRERIKAEIYY